MSEVQMQYSYEASSDGLTTNPLDIYKDAKKIGVVKGSFNNIFKRLLDYLFSSRFPVFIKYEIKDDSGNIRLLSENTSFFRPNIKIIYNESDGIRHEITMKNLKDSSLGFKKAGCTYKGKNYYIYQERSHNPFYPKPAEMYIDKKLIANWKISNKKVVVNILHPSVQKEELLILGLFHTYLYATRG